MQQHAARRMHYDLRLELGGVLVSWAVPRGPSPDPTQKRLAVHVEDHPVEYATFEGCIPQGNYGAGAVIVWDQGTWTAIEDPEAGMQHGKLLFELRGYKLRGRWTLVRTRRKGAGSREGKDWLLIKERDGWASSTQVFPPESVLSGLTVEERRDGSRRCQDLGRDLGRLRLPRRRLRPRDVGLMLAEVREAAFNAAGWIFELKYDGYRLLAARDGEHVELRLRGGGDATPTFPEIACALAVLPQSQVLLDGEVVVPGDDGRPSFQRLQQRVQLTRARDVERAAVEQPATLYAFDLLGCEGFDLRNLPLRERKRFLEVVVPRLGPLQQALWIPERGDALYAEVERLGFEGVVAKEAASPYRSGRSAAWRKIRVDCSEDFAVVGFTRPRGVRHGFGALHLGLYDGDTLTYVGRVGSGFTQAALEQIGTQLEGAGRSAMPPRGQPPRGPGHVWIEPTLVCEVRYKERSAQGLLRQPVFVRLRSDKSPAECRASRDGEDAVTPGHSVGRRAIEPGARPGPGPGPPVRPRVEPPVRSVEISNPEKIFWPADGYTKGDLIAYYRGIAPRLLPWLRDRPLVLTRYPDGITGKSFYQKDAPAFVPDWLRTERIWSEHAGREIRHVVCDDRESLLYLVNLGTIPIHMWASRAGALGRPDWCVLDLDPKEAPFTHVVRVAREIRTICTAIGLEAFVKTSGASGLHVLLPLGGQCTYEQSRLLGELLSQVVLRRLPRIATVARALGARGGRVYLDYLQNRHGQTIVAPYAVRPLPGAPVSMPLRWREVGRRLDPRRFTIRTAPARVRRWQLDPCRPVLERRPDLLAILSRLESLL